MQTNSKNIITPKTYNGRDVYQHFAEQLLKQNPQYWGKYSKPKKMRNFWIYTNDVKGGKVIEIMNYDRWCEIVEKYFMSARRFITNGEPLNMGKDVGRIEPRRVERNHKNPKINFLETNARPKVKDENGVLRPDMIVYYTGDDWVRIAWVKTKHITNETAYKFIPCQGDNTYDGFKEQFSNANIKNPALKFNYKFHPYVRSKPLRATG